MTENGRMPAELEPIEQLLSSDSRPTPSAKLRQRLLGGVRTELRRQRRRRRVRYTAAIAAVLLIGVGFTVSAAKDYIAAQKRQTQLPSNYIIAEPQVLSVGTLLQESLRRQIEAHSAVKAGNAPPAAVHFDIQFAEPKKSANKPEKNANK